MLFSRTVSTLILFPFFVLEIWLIFSVTARIIMLFNVDAVSYRMYTNYTWKVNHARLQFLSSRTPLIFAQQTTILCVSNIELFIWKMFVNPHAHAFSVTFISPFPDRSFSRVVFLLQFLILTNQTDNIFVLPFNQSQPDSLQSNLKCVCYVMRACGWWMVNAYGRNIPNYKQFEFCFTFQSLS